MPTRSTPSLPLKLSSLIILLISLLSVSFVPAQTTATAVPGRFLVLYRNGQLPSDAAAHASSVGAHLVQRHELVGLAVLDSVSDGARTQLALDPNVEAIVPDLILQAHSVITRPVGVLPPAASSTADGLYHSPQGWAVRQVGGFGTDGTKLPPKGPWNTSKGNGVRIALLDSGVDPNHPDIAPNLALNLSEVDKTALPSACDDGSAIDQEGHGTWTASLAAGALGPFTGLVAGVAPSATILNIKVLERVPAVATSADPTGCLGGQGSGLLSWMIQGIEDAVTNHANIISMSFGALIDITTGDGAGQQAIFNRATAAAYNAGVLLIAAAGNDGYNLANSRYVELPAQSLDVLAVIAATNPACAENLTPGASCIAGPVTLPYYSNYGAGLNALAAPGGSYPSGGALNPTTSASTVSGWITGACSDGISSTLSGLPTDSAHSLGCFNLGHAPYVQAMGTSASAPLVAGAAALILSANPTWSPAQVTHALRTSASLPTAHMPAAQVDVAPLLVAKQR